MAEPEPQSLEELAAEADAMEAAEFALAAEVEALRTERDDFKDRFMRALRSPLTAYRLLAEYVAAVRTQGWWRANSLSWEYVMRLLGRGQRPDDR